MCDGPCLPIRWVRGHVRKGRHVSEDHLEISVAFTVGNPPKGARRTVKESEDAKERRIFKTKRMNIESKPMCRYEQQVGTHPSNLAQTPFRLVSVNSMGGRYRFCLSTPKRL